MPFATGVNKQLRYKVEATFGLAPGATGAQLLRRVTSGLRLGKEGYQSNEIASNQQVTDMRHGMRRVEGAIEGELSPGTYKDFIAACVRRAWTPVTAITGASITVAGSGPTYTITRAAGSYLTDGIKVGMIVRLTAGSFNAANLNKNLKVIALTATIATVMPLNGVALFAEGPIASATMTIPGKITYVPTSAHTNLSYAIEHWHSDISRSHLYRGCKVNELAFQCQPGGMARLSTSFIGQDVTRAGTVYYTTPTAETTVGVISPVSGLFTLNGAAFGALTGLDLTVSGNLEAAQVIGSTIAPDVFPGRVTAAGRFSAYFENGTLPDFFDNESEIALLYALAASSAANADFVAMALPRIKVGGADDSDGEKGLVLTLPFTGLFNSAGGSGVASEATTFWMQDSLA
jgi:hypothetical protein